MNSDLIVIIKEYQMQSAKGSHIIKFDQYDVTITPFNEKKIQISVIDPFEKMQFHQKLLTLNTIGSTTLLKALEKKTLEIKMAIKVNKTPESAILQIDVLVASQFLKPVEQVIYLKKTRDISQSQILKNAVSLLSNKIKSLKDNDKNNHNIVRASNPQIEQKSYNAAAIYDPIASISLPKGKHVVTISFLTKATNSWMYLYFGQGQQCMQNCGFYVPTNSQFIPFVVRKLYTVNGAEETVTFTTYCANSYPIVLKNVVVSAQQLE